MSTTACLEVVPPRRVWDRRRRRHQLVLTTSTLLVVVLAAAAMLVGAAGLDLGDVVGGLTGRAEPADVLVVRQLRLPRVVAAVAVGAAFGTAGALFQSTLRNALASPDVLGVSGGASVGAVWGLLVLGASGTLVTGLAAGGALAVTAAIWVLAWRQGLHGIRFVLVGIGFAYLTSSVVAWLLTGAEVRQAAQALLWTVGSVGDVRGGRLVGLVVVVGMLLVVVTATAGRQRVLALGDDLASGLGVPATRGRAAALLLGVGLVAAATSVAGPIPFVALVAPAIARGLLDDGDPALLVSGAIGAALVLTADLAGQHALPGQLTAPAGIVTGLVGAPYLLILLARHTRSAGGPA